MRKKQGKNIDGKKLAELRKLSGKTQEEVAKLTGISRSAIAKMESGAENASVDDLIALAECYNTTVDYLLGLSSAKTKSAEIKQVCDYIGLDEESVNNLKYKTTYGLFAYKYTKVLNHLFHSEDFFKIIDCYADIIAVNVVKNLVSDYSRKQIDFECEQETEDWPEFLKEEIPLIFDKNDCKLEDYTDGIGDEIDFDDFTWLFNFKLPTKPERSDFEYIYSDSKDMTEEEKEEAISEEFEEAIDEYEFITDDIVNKYDEFCKKPFEFIRSHFADIDTLRYRCLKAIERISEQIEKF